MTDVQTTAAPVEEWLFCTECQEPHPFIDDYLMLIGEDRESMPCQVPVRVKKLPEDWERTYEAHYAYEDLGEKFVGYDLYEIRPPIDLAIHRPMYYLEAS